MCVCICMSKCMYVRECILDGCVCMCYVYVCVGMCMYVYVCVNMCKYAYVCVGMSMYVLCVCMCINE